MSTGNDDVFEKLVEDFSQIENDPNKNVDEQEEVKEMALSGNKYTVRAQSFDRKTGEPSGEQRDEVIDVSSNFLFRDVQSIGDIEAAYERFWNDLNPESKDIVKVSSITPADDAVATNETTTDTNVDEQEVEEAQTKEDNERGDIKQKITDIKKEMEDLDTDDPDFDDKVDKGDREVEKLEADLKDLDETDESKTDEQEEVKEEVKKEDVPNEVIVEVDKYELARMYNMYEGIHKGKLSIEDFARLCVDDLVTRYLSSEYIKEDDVEKFVDFPYEQEPVESKTDEQEEVDQRELPGYEDEPGEGEEDETGYITTSSLSEDLAEKLEDALREAGLFMYVDPSSVSGFVLSTKELDDKGIAAVSKVNDSVDEKKKPPVCKKCGKAHWPFKKCSAKKAKGEDKVDEQQDVKKIKKLTRCPSCGGVKAKGEILCKKCFAKVVGESKIKRPFSLRDMWELKESEVIDKQKEKQVNEQGGEMVGPIEIEPEEFDIVANTLDRFVDIDPDLEGCAGQGNVTIVITDGKRFIGVDPQGYEYARYKTDVVDSAGEVMRLAKDEGNWLRKHTKGV